MPNKFTQKAQNTLNLALQSARELGHTYIGSEHILLGLLAENDSIAAKLLVGRGADVGRIKGAVIDISGIGDESHVTPEDMTPRARRIIEASGAEAARSGSKFIGTEHILFALLSERDCVATRLLEAEGISSSEFMGELCTYLSSNQKGKDRGGARQKDSTYDEKPKIHGAPMLSSHARDLTAMARDGRIDPTVGRQKETDRVIQILSRRTKNNPCLIGEPGVGKTAVVEGLAHRIVTKNVPEALIGKRIITLNIPSMIAGAKYRGEFEDRMKTVMEEVEKNPDIILFIDEIHIIIGAGAAEGAVDAANIIKPALARGQMQVIGATTTAEYRMRIERDSALERRFQSVTVSEPTESEAVDILMGLREKYEEHHKLHIEASAILAAVKYSMRYIPDRFLPDKAIDLIDEAASKVRIRSSNESEGIRKLRSELSSLYEEKQRAVEHQDFELAASIRDKETRIRESIEEEKLRSEEQMNSQLFSVNENDIAEVVTEWTGIPVSRILGSEYEKLITLEDNLKKRIIGQDEAIETVAQAIRRGRVGLCDPKRPISSFVFIGQTGVGKTELSNALALEMFGSEAALIRLDMSEYMEKHSVSRLIGSPPGYVGYEDGGQLTEKVRRRPYSVILFDEIEKAHPDVFNILLQILEDGSLTDSQGRRADFTNSIVILTSNAGADEDKSKRILGFSHESEKSVEKKAKMKDSLKKLFRPELLGRVDEVIFFNALDIKDMENIARSLLRKTEERAKAINIPISFGDDIPAFLANKGFYEEAGARSIRHALVKYVENPLSEEILRGNIHEGTEILAKADGERIVFSTIQ